MYNKSFKYVLLGLCEGQIFKALGFYLYYRCWRICLVLKKQTPKWNTGESNLLYML